MHHVYSRGVRREALFVDDDDRRTYLRALGNVVGWFRWRCLAYCLMSNHVHLLIETPNPNLGDGMRRLHSVYARGFNRRHGYTGCLFERRYGARRVNGDDQLMTTLRYIALNPVEAGLCRDALGWRWSSYALLMEGVAPAWVDGARVRAYLGAWGAELKEVARTGP